MAKQEFVVRTGDPKVFIDEVIRLAQEGAVRKENTFPRLKGFPITVTLVKEVKGAGEEKSTPTSQAVPVKRSEQVYNKEELEEMEWEDFRALVGAHGIKGRDRALMTKKYLKAVEDKAAGEEVVEQSCEEEEK